MSDQMIFEAVFIVVSFSILSVCLVVIAWLFLRQENPKTKLGDILVIIGRELVARPRSTAIAGGIYLLMVLLFPHKYAHGLFLVSFTCSVLLAFGQTGFLGYEWKQPDSAQARSERSAYATMIVPTGVWFAVACLVEWLKMHEVL